MPLFGKKKKTDEQDNSSVSVTVYPVIRFGKIIPEVAWDIQEKIAW